ncbi:MAG: L-arabinonate dehydratase, partial [Verrucomicrobiota bacterium]
MTTPSRRSPESLRSWRWFGRDELRSFGHRSRAAQAGLDPADYKDRPVIGILNTWSDLNSCHLHFKATAEQIKKGVYQAGGLPLEIPIMSCGETYTKPTSMLYRNFLAMETEEILRGNPLDGAVLMGGCDKSTPALLMGALSMNIPVIYVPCGPMLRGNWHGQTLASGSDVWKYWDEKRAGNLSDEAWEDIENGIARSPGHCMTMGTAATMTSLAEVLGFSLPGAASIPAVDANHHRMATQSGRRIVENVWHDAAKPRDLMTEASLDNAIKVDMAIGGSTNAIVHLTAMAGRAGIQLSLERFDALSKTTPLLADVRPAGRFVMEDFYFAGGLRALLKEMGELLDLETPTVNGHTLGENIAEAQTYNAEVIRSRSNPVSPSGGTAALSGNLAPNGAVIKHAAADPALLQHTGPAIVFEDYNHLKQRIDDPDLDVTRDSVLVLRHAGPQGGPGMPEWGMLPIPRKLLEEGVRDMVRISDARMSGTSYGTCVLHVAPESAVGGPLALVRDGDLIELDVPNRKLELNVSDEELAERKKQWQPRPTLYQRGYGKMYMEHILQADEGCD